MSRQEYNENLYNLPLNWEKKEIFSFGELAETIGQIHTEAQYSAIKAINKYATVRNYLIGFYIVEYEQKGCDRAVYGEKLLKRLSNAIHIKGINETLLKNSRRFYLTYPQIRQYLNGTKSPTASDLFTTSADKIISQLSFSHIVEIKMTPGDNPPVGILLEEFIMKEMKG